MPEKRKILIQLDSDPLPSAFDRVVAIDSGADEVFSYGGIGPDQVRDLVYGAIFTRGPKDLHRTALFVGGSDLALGEEILTRARESFLGDLRVSVLLDSSGANTTAAAAVLAVVRHLDPGGAPLTILGGTGAVGRRVARLLLRLGASVRLGSRNLEHAETACRGIRSRVTDGQLVPVVTAKDRDLLEALEGVVGAVAAGGAGVLLLPRSIREKIDTLRIAVDLNAVPPAGIEGIDVMDEGNEREGVTCYGAIGVGGTKMKIHKAAVAALFERNDQVLDAEEVFDLGMKLPVE